MAFEHRIVFLCEYSHASGTELARALCPGIEHHIQKAAAGLLRPISGYIKAATGRRAAAAHSFQEKLRATFCAALLCHGWRYADFSIPGESTHRTTNRTVLVNNCIGLSAQFSRESGTLVDVRRFLFLRSQSKIVTAVQVLPSLGLAQLCRRRWYSFEDLSCLLATFSLRQLPLWIVGIEVT